MRRMVPCLAALVLCLATVPAASATSETTRSADRPKVASGVWVTHGPYGGAVLSLAIATADTRTIYAGTRVGVFRSIDAGASWDGETSGFPRASVTSIAVDPLDPRTAYAGTARKGVFGSTDGGETWTAANDGLPSDINVIAIDPSHPDVLYAGTYGEGLFRSTDGGATWGQMNEGLGSDYIVVFDLAIDPSDPNTLYAAAGTVFKTTDAGRHWQAAGIGLNAGSIAIDPSNTDVLYAGTTMGVYKSTDAGTNWLPSNQGIEEERDIVDLLVDPMDPQVVYLVAGGLFRSLNAGASWSEVHATSGEWWNYVVALDPTDSATLYVGAYEGVFKSTDAGMTWTGADDGILAIGVRALAVDPRDEAVVYAATAGRGVYRSSDGGSSWGVTGLEVGYVYSLAIDPTHPRTIYCSGGLGVRESSDAGRTWTVLPELDSSGADLMVDPTTGTLYAGVPYGGVVRWMGDKHRWKWLGEGLGSQYVTSLAIDPADPQVLYAGTGDRGVFKTVDGGRSWRPTLGSRVGVVRDLAVATSRPHTLYAATDEGVFVSNDAASSWSATSLEVTVREVAVDSTDPSVVFAGTRDGVLRSVNAGIRWSPMNEGLSNTKVAALILGSKGTLYAGAYGGGSYRFMPGR